MASNTSAGQRALVAGVIILGILFTTFFGMRVFHAFRRFDGHRPPPGAMEMETDVEFDPRLDDHPLHFQNVSSAA